jgi:NAD-dependent SIR2 family protein deacetylase
VQKLPQKEGDIHFSFVEKKLNPNDAIISLNYDTLIDFALEKKGIPFEYFLKTTSTKDALPLIKVHGSINWLYCPSCYAFFTYNHQEIEKIFSPQPELCPEDRSYLKGILIPPTYFKNYHHPIISNLWIKAGQVTKRAKRIFFIGLSFSNADIWIKYLLKKYIFLNSNEPELYVINPEQRGIVKDRFERIFGKITYLKMTFKEWIDLN